MLIELVIAMCLRPQSQRQRQVGTPVDTSEPTRANTVIRKNRWLVRSMNISVLYDDQREPIYIGLTTRNTKPKQGFLDLRGRIVYE